VRTRSGDPYKPSALRAYEQALRQLVKCPRKRVRSSLLVDNRTNGLAGFPDDRKPIAHRLASCLP